MYGLPYYGRGIRAMHSEVAPYMYFGHIHSHLNYGLTVWGIMLSASQLSDLWKAQDECINIVAGLLP